MNKKLVVVPILLAAAAAGGYSYYWNQKAEDLKLLVEQTIAHINEKSKPYTEGAEVIKYESLSTSGWPMKIDVQIQKPTITIPLHALAHTLENVTKTKTASEDGIGGIPDAKPFPLKVAEGVKWTETITSDSLTIGTNPTASTYTLTYGKEQSMVTNYNGELSPSRISAAKSPTVCSMKIVNPTGETGFFDVKKMLGDGSDFIKRFRSVDCTAQGVDTLDSATKEVLMSVESAAFGASFDNSNSAKTTGRIYGQATNQKASKAYDAMINKYIVMVYKLFMDKNYTGMSGFGTPLSELGNNNVEFSMSFEGPTDPALLMSKEMVFHAGVDSFKIRNDIMNTDFSLLLRSSPNTNAEKRDSSIVLKSNSSFTERYDTLKLQEIIHTLEMMAKDTSADAKELQDVLKKFTPEELKMAISDLWPRFHPLGNMVLAIDIAATTPNPPSPSGELVINNLDYVNSLDGIKISGKGTQQGLLPTGQLNITCLTCEGMLDRIYAYTKLLDKWIPKMDGSYKAPMVSEELHNGVKAFLKAISVAAKDGTGKEVMKDWYFGFNMPEGAEPTLNSKPLNTVMESFGQHVAPYLPQSGEQGHSDDMPPSEYQPEDQKGE